MIWLKMLAKQMECYFYEFASHQDLFNVWKEDPFCSLIWFSQRLQVYAGSSELEHISYRYICSFSSENSWFWKMGIMKIFI